MRKTYRYKNLTYAVSDETEVEFTVEFVSDGNMGQTILNIPGNSDPEIEDSGSKLIGTGVDLRGETTVVVTDVANLAPEEDEIRIRYLINGHLLMEHVNLKSEAERAFIFMFIQFTKP
ncbi:MAG: hypothetical protein WC341_06915 [Bacteroidales bacterium]|jgi:hypothetical protein